MQLSVEKNKKLTLQKIKRCYLTNISIVSIFFGIMIFSYSTIHAEILTEEPIRPSNYISAWLNASTAERLHDTKAASYYFNHDMLSDRSLGLFDYYRLYLVYLRNGNIDQATDYAHKILEILNTRDKDLLPTNAEQILRSTSYMLIVREFNDENYDNVIEINKKYSSKSDITNSHLINIWALVGQEKWKEAVKISSTLKGTDDKTKQITLMNHILLADSQEYPEKIMALIKTYRQKLHLIPPQIMNIIIDAMVAMNKSEQYSELANSVLDFYTKLYQGNNPQIVDYIRHKREANSTYKRHYTSAQAMGLLFYFANYFPEQRFSNHGLFILNIANFLYRDNSFISLALAREYALIKQYSMVQDIAMSISSDDFNFLQANYILSDSYLAENKTELVEELLKNLVKDYPHHYDLIIALAGHYQTQKEYESATILYSDYINSNHISSSQLWHIYFLRGTSYERNGQWAKAEEDFLKSLSYNPDNPTVLNYLAYSWVDKNINLDKALGMLKKAVNRDPSAYIIDSLGWAYYRLGQYDLAVKELERAVKLGSSDPTIIDHLGDAYEKVGRKLEAVYEWRKALTLDPDAQQRQKLIDKISQYDTAS